jgi:hypothetical protein
VKDSAVCRSSPVEANVPASNVRAYEDLVLDLTTAIHLEEEVLRHVVLRPRLWFLASTMGESQWERAVSVVSLVTTANRHVAPQFFFVTTDVPGLINSDGLRRVRDADHTEPCLMEVYRRYLEGCPDVAPCRQVDLVAAVPAIRRLSAADAVNLGVAGFRPMVYVTDHGELCEVALPCGVGVVVDMPWQQVTPAIPSIATLWSRHLVVWRNRDFEARFGRWVATLSHGRGCQGVGVGVSE